MKKILKWILISLGAGLLIFAGFWIFLMYAFSGVFDKFCTKEDLIDNYKKRSAEIAEVKSYINKIVPPGKRLDIEFEGNSTIKMFHISGQKDRTRNIKVNSLKTDTLLRDLGWSKETLITLQTKLNNANCISVQSGEPCKIGFQRSGAGKYFYNLFERPIPDKLKSNYNDSCTYILFNENVVFEYGGGVFGIQCFPGYQSREPKEQ